MPLSSTINTPVPRNKPYPFSAGSATERVRAARSFAEVRDDVARVFEGFQKSLDDTHRALRESQQEVEDLHVEDDQGLLVGRVGEWEEDGEYYRGGHFIELYVGDSVGDRLAQDAPFYTDSYGHVFVGKNGYLDVLDPYSGDAAWIGTQWDALAVTGAVSNGGLIRLTVTGHTLLTGDSVMVDNVGGVPNARGLFTVTVIDPNTVDLQGSVWDGVYVSGGWVQRLLHVTGAVNNGAGLIRLTVTGHGYESGDKANVASVGGVPNATGQWIVTVVDANTIDLEGTTFAGAYTAGGTCLRFFAGGLFQNIAIGPSFDDYRLRAFPDGSLKIRDAAISVSGISSLGDPFTFTVDDGKVTIDGIFGAMRSTMVMTGGYTAIMSPDFPSLRAELSLSGLSLDGVVGSDGAGFYVNVLGMVPYIEFRDPAFALLFGVNSAGAVNAVSYQVSGSTVISSTRNADFNSVNAPTYYVGGVAGATASHNVATAVVPTTATINYKDHAGANASMVVVTGVAVTLQAQTFSSGLRTA